MLFPLVLILLSLAQVAYQIQTTGEFVQRGVSLKGGVTLTIQRDIADIDSLSAQLTQALPKSDLDIRRGPNTIIIDAADTTSEALLAEVKKQIGELSKEEYSVNQVGSSLGASFFKEMFFSIGLAYLFMGLVVLITYRTWTVSLMVMSCAFADMFVTLAVFNFLGFKLSSAGIAAFLMLVGYSIDTDILLSSRVLKSHEGSVLSRVYSAMRTGFTMNNTTLAAVVVCLLATKSEVIKQIMIILLIGLVADVIFTWVQNAGMLRWYLEKQGDEK